MILGAGQMQLPAFHAAHQLGCRVVAVDRSSDAPGSALADAFHTLDLSDIAGCIAIARRHDVDGALVLAADYPIPALAAVCEALHLPGPSTAAARRATNKAAMRSALHAAGVPVPAWFVVSTGADAREAVRRIDGGAVVKPADSSGSRGITCLEPACPDEDIAGAFDRATRFSRSGQVLVEAFVDGPEFSIEAVTFRGRTQVVAVTDKVTSGPPFFVEIGHSQPSQWPEAVAARLGALATAAVAALGIDNTGSHTEIRLGRDGPQVIEIGARLGGGFITTHLVPLSTGVDLVRAVVQIALGIDPDIHHTRDMGAAIRFLTPPAGRVLRISGLDDAARIPGVEAIVVGRKIGDRIEPLLDASARIGHVICGAPDAATAIRRAERARDLITIATKA